MKKLLVIILAFLSCNSQKNDLSKYSNKELFGQMIMLGIKDKILSEDEKRWIKDYAIGSILLLKRNVSLDAYELVETLKHYQSYTKQNSFQLPFLIAVDQENGMISRLHGLLTNLPNNYALGILNDTVATKLVAEISGKELLALGIHWSLSPVADVNSNPKNPIIGVRSFGEDQHLVKNHVNAYIKGLSHANTLSSIKHFPGHGDTKFDSHYDKVVINRSLNDLKRVDLIPFDNLNTNNAASSLMISHIQLPKIDPENLPSTISNKIHSLIPKSYDGIIISDELEMNALAKFHNPYKSVVRMINLGTNVIIMARALKQRVDIDKMFSFVDSVASSDKLFRNRLEKSVKKIIQLKETYKEMTYQLDHFAKFIINHQKISDSLFLSIPYSKTNLKLNPNTGFSFSKDRFTSKIVKKYQLKLTKKGNRKIQFINKKNKKVKTGNILISIEDPYVLDSFPNKNKYCFYNRYAPVNLIFNNIFNLNSSF